MDLKNTSYAFIIFISMVIILIYGQSIILPFILGILLWLIMRALKSALDKIPFVRDKFPNWLKNVLSSVVLLVVLNFVLSVVSSNINALRLSLETYEPNMALIIKKINEVFKVNVVNVVREQSGDLDFGDLLGAVFNSLSGLISNTFMIILYSLFVLLEESSFRSKLHVLFDDKEGYQKSTEMLYKIEHSITQYFQLKTLVSLITGGLSYIVLQLIGVDSPVFWAFLIFILNFIPTIGSLIATIFPAIFCLLQFGEFTPSLTVLFLVGGIQVLVGNIIEPRLMGTSMNVSPLVTIVALSFWGFIWGIPGMILSVPITVIMIIAFSQFENTRTLAILLSEKGQLEGG